MSFPFIATLTFIIGLAVLAFALLLSMWRYRPRAANGDEALKGLPAVRCVAVG